MVDGAVADITSALGLFTVVWSRLVWGFVRMVAMRGRIFGGIAGVCSFVMVTLLGPYASASAETLMLRDGTVIHGEIKALQDDVYTVETDSLGTVRVRKQDIRAIDHSDSSRLDRLWDRLRGHPPSKLICRPCNHA